MVQLCKSLEKVDLLLFLSAVEKGRFRSEIKIDGIRARFFYKNKKLTIKDRYDKDITFKYPEFKDFKHNQDIILDGEMCVLDETGKSIFNGGINKRFCEIDSSIKEASKQYPVKYIIFDILELGSHNLRMRTLRERLEVLNVEFNKLAHNGLKLVESDTDIIRMWNDVMKKNKEGIIIKDLNSLYYENKRSGSWKKVKNVKEVSLKFTKFTEHNQGIRIETTQGISVNVNGYQSQIVKNDIINNGESKIECRHLGETNNGRYRQPVFFRRIK